MKTLKINWTEPRSPNKEISYDHSIGETPFGRFLITWKGHKDIPSYDFDETPWGKPEYRGWGSLEAAQRWAEDKMLRKVKKLDMTQIEEPENARRVKVLIGADWFFSTGPLVEDGIFDYEKIKWVDNEGRDAHIPEKIYFESVKVEI